MHRANSIYSTWSHKLSTPVLHSFIHSFIYLGCDISHATEKTIPQKLAKFSQILGILNNIFKPNLVTKFSRIRVHNALDLPSNSYGSEIWTLGKFGPL
jgi:hypothetical protein